METQDFNSLLKKILEPISETNPVGAYLKYEDTYDSITDAMRADRDLEQGLWKQQLKKSEWDKAITICTEALQNKTKDLQIAAWLMQSLLRKYGFVGLKQGLTILLELCKKYWDVIYPNDESGDIEIRLAPLFWIEEKFYIQLKLTPITISQPQIEPYTYDRWERESKQQDEEGDFNPISEYLKYVIISSEEFYKNVDSNVNESIEIFRSLKKFLKGKIQDNFPHFIQVEKTLQDIITLNSFALKEIERLTLVNKESEEVKDSDIKKVDSNEEALMHQREIDSIDSAYKFLSEISDFLIENEPNYPTGYMVKHALKYRYSVLKEFLEEKIKDKNQLGKIFEILNIS